MATRSALQVLGSSDDEQGRGRVQPETGYPEPYKGVICVICHSGNWNHWLCALSNMNPLPLSRSLSANCGVPPFCFVASSCSGRSRAGPGSSLAQFRAALGLSQAGSTSKGRDLELVLRAR